MGRLQDLIKSAIAYELDGTRDVTRRELQEAIGDEYEMQGVPKEQIGERIRQAIEPALERAVGHKVSIYTAHHHRILKAKGWLHPQGAGKGGRFTSEKNAGFVSAISEVQDQVLFVKAAARDLDMSELSTENYNLLCREIRAHAAIMHDTADAKTKLPPNLHMLFRSILGMASGMNAIARTFHAAKTALLLEVKGACEDWITPKQAAKVRDWRETGMLPLVRPKTRDMAIFMGWYGLQCPECASWATAVNPEGGMKTEIKCSQCGHVWPGYTVSHCLKCHIPFYQEDIAKMRARGKKTTCYSCGMFVYLPEELMIA